MYVLYDHLNITHSPSRSCMLCTLVLHQPRNQPDTFESRKKRKKKNDRQAGCHTCMAAGVRVRVGVGVKGGRRRKTQKEKKKEKERCRCDAQSFFSA